MVVKRGPHPNVRNNEANVDHNEHLPELQQLNQAGPSTPRIGSEMEDCDCHSAYWLSQCLQYMATHIIAIHEV